MGLVKSRFSGWRLIAAVPSASLGLLQVLAYHQGGGGPFADGAGNLLRAPRTQVSGGEHPTDAGLKSGRGANEAALV